MEKTIIIVALVVVMKSLLALKTEALVLILIYRINYFLNLLQSQTQDQDWGFIFPKVL